MQPQNKTLDANRDVKKCLDTSTAQLLAHAATPVAVELGRRAAELLLDRAAHKIMQAETPRINGEKVTDIRKSASE